MVKFGAPLFDLTTDDFIKPGLIFQIGIIPRRIDILTSIDGVTFEDAWKLRQEIPVDDIRVQVISRPHLLQNKKKAGWPKDRVDVAWLEDENRKD